LQRYDYFTVNQVDLHVEIDYFWYYLSDICINKAIRDTAQKDCIY